MYLTKLRGQEKDLRVKDGWDKSAIEEYFKSANKQTRELTAAEAMKKVAEMYSQTLLVGSDLYTKMYEACSYSDQGKIDMVLKQLGAVIDKNGMLQLSGRHRFDESMSPHDKFLTIWAKTVQTSYEGKELTDDKVHQLRMYIDRNNINYVREKFGKGVSDEEALKRYASTEQPVGFGGKLTKEPARLHNKYPETSSYEEFIAGKENKKRVVNNDFHSEFIIDPDGNFVSQWNVLTDGPNGTVESDPKEYNYTDEFREQMLDGESFNYAKKKGESHEQLDSDPPGKYDHGVRKKAKEGWKSPSEREFNYSKDKKKKDSYSE